MCRIDVWENMRMRLCESHIKHQYLQKKVETIQRRALITIYGLAPFEDHLCVSGLVSLKDRHVKMSMHDHKLNFTTNPKPQTPNPVNVVNPWEMPHQLIPLNLEQIVIEIFSFLMLWWTCEGTWEYNFVRVTSNMRGNMRMRFCESYIKHVREHQNGILSESHQTC